jgi:DNA-binding NarL/FixJ family response regulator
MKTKIILADDHKILRDGLCSLIEKQQELELIGEAENGLTAVQLACELKPDVVIMDITMPDINGIEATKQIMAKTPGVKVIALSMHSDKRFIAGMFEAGASGYLLKESAFEEMVKAISVVTSNGIYISPDIAGIVVKDYVDHLSMKTQSKISLLSNREYEVLIHIIEGENMKQVASKLNISIKTVEIHRKHIMEKLGVQSTTELTKFAIREGLVSLYI